jgi:hypothetical protein
MSWFDDDYEREREESHLATPSESVAEWARNYGAEVPDRAWLLHDWDVWVANPFYSGPAVKHPEADEPVDTDGDMNRAPEWSGFDSPEMDDNPDDEIPF